MATPPLQSLIEDVRRASGYKLTQQAIARAAKMPEETLSRWIRKEKDGRKVPDEVIYKISVAHKHLLAPAKKIIEEEKLLSDQERRIMKLESTVAFLASYVFSQLTAGQKKAAEAAIGQDIVEQLAKWKAEGTF